MSPMPTRRRCTGERGAAAVELALVAPIMIMLLFGIVEFGRGYSAKIAITSAAREGARAVALGDNGAAAATAAAGDLAGPLFSVTAPSTCTPGNPVTVTTRYRFQIRIPLVPNRTVDLQSRGVMRCGG